jgi:hypothetical protein
MTRTFSLRAWSNQVLPDESTAESDYLLAQADAGPHCRQCRQLRIIEAFPELETKLSQSLKEPLQEEWDSEQANRAASMKRNPHLPAYAQFFSPILTMLRRLVPAGPDSFRELRL